MSRIETDASHTSRSRFGQKLYEDLHALPSRQRVSSGELERVYGLAYAHVTQGQYVQALPIFAFLATYSPSSEHYLAGLALSLQMCERFSEAIDIYSLISILSPGNPEPALQVAECQLMLGHTSLAAAELDRVVRAIAQANGRYDSVRPRALILQALVGGQAH